MANGSDGWISEEYQVNRAKREAGRAVMPWSVVTSAPLPDVDNKSLGSASLESIEV